MEERRRFAESANIPHHILIGKLFERQLESRFRRALRKIFLEVTAGILLTGLITAVVTYLLYQHFETIREFSKQRLGLIVLLFVIAYR